MGKYHIRSSHLSLIAKTHVRYSIRGGAGLMFVFFTLAAGLIMAHFVISPVEDLRRLDQEMGGSAATEEILDEVVEEIGMPAVKFFTGADDEQAAHLLLEKPALVSAYLVILVFFWPFLISLGAFNQTSGDIANRGLRYQLLRTERANIFIGRFLGTFLFSLLVQLALFAIVTIYLVVKAKFYPAGDVIFWLLQAAVVLAAYSLAWIALCAWISSFIDSPFGSLALSQVFIGVWPVLVLLLERVHDSLSYASYLSPWGFKWWLFSPNVGKLLGGIGAMLAFTALFGWLGLRHFQKRDL